MAATQRNLIIFIFDRFYFISLQQMIVNDWKEWTTFCRVKAKSNIQRFVIQSDVIHLYSPVLHVVVKFKEWRIRPNQERFSGRTNYWEQVDLEK